MSQEIQLTTAIRSKSLHVVSENIETNLYSCTYSINSTKTVRVSRSGHSGGGEGCQDMVGVVRVMREVRLW